MAAKKIATKGKDRPPVVDMNIARRGNQQRRRHPGLRT